MQNRETAIFNLTEVKTVIICKQKQAYCLQISKLIPLVCKTLGFLPRNPCFQTVISYISENTSILYIYAIK